MSTWTALLPIALAFVGSVLALAADAVGQRRAAVSVSAIVLFGAAVAAGWIAVNQDITTLSEIPLAVGRGYSAITAVVFFVAAIALVGAYRSLEDVPSGGQVAALVALLAVSSAVMATALDLLLIIIALEGIAMTSYALVSVTRDRRADEAAMKYFVQGAVATGFALYALSLIFGLFGGNLGLADIASGVSTGGRPALLAMALLIATYAFKLSAFPFHSWAPDAYETTRPSVAAFMATAPKLAILGSLMLVLPLVGFSAEQFGPSGFFLLAVLAVASVVFGNFAGLKQSSFTRMLAYSGIAQVGYALVGAAAMFLMPLGERGAYSVIAAGTAYALAAAGAFMAAQAVRSAIPSWDGSISGLSGLGRARPVLAAALAVMLLSLTGIPLTAGFWGKFLVFSDAVAAGHAWLAVVGMIGSVVSFGYYGNVMRAMYLDEPVKLPAVSVGAEKSTGTADQVAEFAVVVLAVIVLALGTLPFLLGFDFLGGVFAVL